MTAKPRVFVSRIIPENGLAKIRAACEAEIWQDPLPPPRQALLEKIVGCEGVLTLLTDAVNAEFFDAAGPQLKVVSNFAVGFRPGQTDLVVVPIDEKNGTVTAGSPLTITDANRASVKKRDIQGRFVVKTTDGQTYRLSIIPSVPKLMAAAYQLPVDQKAEYEAFTALRDKLTTA